MYLYFDALDIVSFKAYRDPAHVPLERMGRGLWFVKGQNLINPRLGSNGAAKSTLFDCICWVLYGQSVGKHRTPDMRGWHEKAPPPEASVTLSVGQYHNELEQCVIRRKGVNNGLWLNDKVVTQETVDSLLGLSFANFLHTIVLGQGKALFFDLTATEKMDVLSETLNLGKWDDRIARARKKVAKLNDEYVREDAEHISCTRSIRKLEDSLDDMKNKSSEWERARADADEIKRRTIADLEKQLEQHQRALGDADLSYDNAETELRHSQTELDKLQADHRSGIKDLSTATANLQMCVAAENALIVKREKHQTGDRCSYCDTKLDKRAARFHLDQILDELDAAKDATDKARAALEDAKAEDKAAMSRELAVTRDIQKFRNMSNDAIDARTRAQGHVNRVKAELDAAKRVRTETEEKTNPYDELTQNLRVDLKKAKQDLNVLAQNIKDIERERALNTYWIDGFKQVRLHLIDEMLAELEGVTQTLLSSVGLDAWRITYDIEKETQKGTSKPGLNVSIYQPEYDRAVKWGLFSGGESQRLRLIGAVALSEVLLRRAGVVCDMLVLDEPTRHLSPEGVRDTVDFLIQRAQDAQVLFVDHAAIDTNRMRGVLRVTRDGEGARVTVSR